MSELKYRFSDRAESLAPSVTLAIDAKAKEMNDKAREFQRKATQLEGR